MERIFYNARLHALDGVLPQTALAVENGRICALGSDDELLARAGEGVERIDLGGRTVYAGFGDTHMHLLHFGVTLSEAELKDAHSMDEVKRIIREFIDKNRVPSGTVVYAHGWNQDLFPDRHIPTRLDLDEVSDVHPIVASRICGHLVTGNTAALKHFGITSETRVPGGEVLLDENGIPTGVVTENATELFYKSSSDVPVERVMDILRASTAYAASRGITSVHSDDLHGMTGCSPQTVVEAYRRLAEADELSVRVNEQCQLVDDEEFNWFFGAGYGAGQTFGAFKLNSRKIISDGSLGGRTACMRAPYADDPTTCGILCYTSEELDKMVLQAHERNMPVAVHAIGDKAMELALNAIEKAQKARPDLHPRHGIVHCQITDEGLLDRFRELGVQAYVQPVFLEYDAHIAAARVGEDLAATSYNWKSLLERGVNVSGGSDCPVENMDSLPNLYCAMTRMDFDGKPEGGFHPEQNLSAQQALQVFTINAAAASGDEDHRGDLRVGFDADLTILEKDFFDVPAEAVKDVPVFMTVMGGKIRYRADA